jgi:hypothetical protein
MSIESNLYRILEGKISYEGGSIFDPLLSVRKAAQRVYEDVIFFLDDEALSDRQIQIMLMEDGSWSSEKEKRMKDLPKLIENNKVFYFQNYSNPPVRGSYKNLIDIFSKEFIDLTKIRYKYQYLTQEGIASRAMWGEIINRIYKGKNKIGALSHYHKTQPTEIEIKEIAMSNEWGVYSSLSKSPFRKSPLQMTEFQRKLLSWTNIYRNVKAHPEFPGQRVMEDHDAFEGWMIILNRKEGAEKANKTQLKSLKPNARNVFMGQSNSDDFEEIMSLNSPELQGDMRKNIYNG